MNKDKKITILVSILLVLILGGLGTFIILNNKDIKKIVSSNSNKSTKDSTDSNIDWSTYKTYEIKLGSDENVEINKKGIYNISGNLKKGSIIVNTTENVKLILNGVNITSSATAAINVENVKNCYIELVGDNTITTETTDEIDGAIYSKDDLFILGEGSLTITSNKDGIVSKDDLVITSGTINIKAEGDGIKGKDSLTINGGKLDIDAGDDGIHSDGLVEINNGEIKINAVEGIEGTYVKINDGTININSSDDGINATNKSTDYDVVIEINGGDITISMGQGDTDAIDSNGNIYINGGNLTITAQSPFDYDGEAKYSSGKMIINGEETTEITNQFAGGMQGKEINNIGGDRGNPNENRERPNGNNGEYQRRR